MTILDARSSQALEGGASFSLGNRVYRAVWQVTWLLLCRWTPPPLHGWRRLVLSVFGARLSRGTRIYASARIWSPENLSMDEFACLGPGVNCYNQASVHLGARAVVSQGAHLCTGSHDVSDPDFQLIARPVAVDDRAWVAAEAFVGPGVTVGEGAVLGARGVAFRDLPPWTVHRGNPAVQVRVRDLDSNASGNNSR